MFSIQRPTTTWTLGILLAVLLLLALMLPSTTQGAVSQEEMPSAIDTSSRVVTPNLAPNTTVLQIQPSTQTVSVGAVFTTAVTVSGLMSPANGFQFDLLYDSRIVEVVSTSETSFLGTTGRQVICPSPVKQPGQMRLACASTGTAPGPSGEGILATLTFRALAEGESALTLNKVQLPDNGRPAALIPVETQSGHLAVKNKTRQLYLPLIMRQAASNQAGMLSQASGTTASVAAGLFLSSLGLSAFAYLTIGHHSNTRRRHIAWRRRVSFIVLISLIASLLSPGPVQAQRAVFDQPQPLPLPAPVFNAPSSRARFITPQQQANGCFWADLNCDRTVDLSDLQQAATHWDCASGEACYAALYDRDNDGDVDVRDLVTFGNEYDIAPPQVSIVQPAENAVLAGSTVQVTGIVSDSHTIAAVIVNGITATVASGGFMADVPLVAGNHVLTAVATDEVGLSQVTARLVFADQDGPQMTIHMPKSGQAIYTLQPTVAISYTDFYTRINLATLSVQVVNQSGGTTNVTGDLNVTTVGAWGVLSTPLIGDASYTLTVSLADMLGNVTLHHTRFYVPLNPGSITPPVEPVDPGWISGAVYDSTTCDQYLMQCHGLPGAQVILLQVEGFTTTPISGTVVTGPDGFFAFPVAATGRYRLRVDKEGFTYGQRAAEVVRDRSTATNEIFLTPLDPIVTVCDSGGCLHTNSDDSVRVEIPFVAVLRSRTTSAARWP